MFTAKFGMYMNDTVIPDNIEELILLPVHINANQGICRQPVISVSNFIVLEITFTDLYYIILHYNILSFLLFTLFFFFTR